MKQQCQNTNSETGSKKFSLTERKLNEHSGWWKQQSNKANHLSNICWWNCTPASFTLTKKTPFYCSFTADCVLCHETKTRHRQREDRLNRHSNSSASMCFLRLLQGVACMDLGWSGSQCGVQGPNLSNMNKKKRKKCTFSWHQSIKMLQFWHDTDRCSQQPQTEPKIKFSATDNNNQIACPYPLSMYF